MCSGSAMNNIKSFVSGFSQLAEEFTKWVETVDWKAIHERVEYLANDLPNDIEGESVKLMNRGWFVWFLDGYMDDLVEKMKSLINKSEEDQDQHMAQYVAENLRKFKDELLSSYPSRKGQIEDGFSTHESGAYFSSIPTMLALSEGIGRDLYPGIGLFAKQQRKPKTNDIFDSVSSLEVFEEAVLKPLRVASDVTKTINNPTNEEKKLFNRHLIMHGNSDQYGSKMNSLKAISLVFFVHKSLSHLKSATNT